MTAIGFRWMATAWIGLAACGPAYANPMIEWDSKDVVESRMPPYKYHVGPAYANPKDGSNYGSTTLTVADGPTRLLDRVLKRDAKLTGRIVGAPPAAKAGRIRLVDNYGRVLDQAQIKAPKFEFTLDASRSISTGLYLKAELTDAAKAVWSGARQVRMVPTDADPWGDFILGVYNMGTRPGTGELWRRMGLGHRAVQTTNSPAFAVQNDLQFHASNIVYSLLGLYHRDYKRWREIKAAQTRSRGPVALARHRCLSDPKQEKFARDILTAAAMRFKPFRPLHYSIGDEIGIGDMASPHDLCASKWCLPRYRKWLRARYGTAERLNTQWDTKYKSFDEAEMFSTWQALGRAKTGNFSPWADRLEFMDEVLYGAVAKGVAAVRAIDPGATCNISGFQQPSCWGFDHWRLSRTVNCATPYEIGESPDVLMSFWSDGRRGKLHSPGFGSDAERLWQAFLRGYHLSAQWDSWGAKTYSRMIDVEKGKLTPLGEMVRRFADWVHAGPGRMRGRAVRRRDPVAILHSQPSLRGNWILEMTARTDMHDRGDKWVTRGSWSVRQKERSFRVRVSWVQWCHDVGIWPKFVDARQLGGDYLTKQGFKVLILPRVVAMSDATAAAIRRFAGRGGLVVADTWCGLMDARCRMRGRGRGALDDLFGVTRGDWKDLDVRRIAPGAKGVKVGTLDLPFVAFEKTLRATTGTAVAKSKTADVAVWRNVGKGKAVYLNFDMEGYFLHRLSPGMTTAARRYLLEVLREVGVRATFAVRKPGRADPFHPAGHDVCVYGSGRGRLVGVMANPTVMHSDVGGVETRYKNIKDNVFGKAHPAELTVPAGLWTYDLTDGKALGDVRAVKFISQPRQGRLFACWPFEITDLTASAEVARGRVLRVRGRVVTSKPVKDEKLVVAMTARRPDGSEQTAYRRTIDCDAGRFAVELPLGLNERGRWTVTVREPCTGRRVVLKVDLK